MPGRSHGFREDVTYAPHVTIGRLADRAAADRALEEIGRDAIAISARIAAIGVLRLTRHKIRKEGYFALG